MHPAITHFLQTQTYAACLLLIHPEAARLHSMRGELQEVYGWPYLEVGPELSAKLKAVPPRKRPREAQRWVTHAVRALAPGPVLCTAIDLLFEPALELDPLALFRQASRKTRLVVLWPGTYQHEGLAYAVPQHAHYRTWRAPDVDIFCL